MVKTLPTTYLGLPLSLKGLTKAQLDPFILKFASRSACWKGSLMAKSGRLVLLKANLIPLAMYWMSVFKLPIWAQKLLVSRHVADDAIVAQEDAYVEDEEIHYNPIGNLDVIVYQQDMDRTLPYKHMCGCGSDDEDPEEELDEDVSGILHRGVPKAEIITLQDN
ncbi:hypothetical protein D1007_45428 [Hordeum vulgare]|nr:hypothetical protein D1007_45428 [Hordeum vulgare]